MQLESYSTSEPLNRSLDSTMNESSFTSSKGLYQINLH